MKIYSNYQIYTNNKNSCQPKFKGNIAVELPSYFGKAYNKGMKTFIKRMFPTDDVNLTGEALDDFGGKIKAQIDIKMRNGQHFIAEEVVSNIREIKSFTAQTHGKFNSTINNNSDAYTHDTCLIYN